jgi:hypothetical protein
MQRKQLYVVLPAQGRFYWYFKRFSPTWFFRAIGREFARRVQKAQP